MRSMSTFCTYFVTSPQTPQPSQIMKNRNIGEVVYGKVRLVLKSVSTLRTGAGISRPPFLLPRSSLPSSSLPLMVPRSHQMTYGQHGYVTYDIGLFRSWPCVLWRRSNTAAGKQIITWQCWRQRSMTLRPHGGTLRDCTAYVCVICC